MKSYVYCILKWSSNVKFENTTDEKMNGFCYWYNMNNVRWFYLLTCANEIEVLQELVDSSFHEISVIWTHQRHLIAICKLPRIDWFLPIVTILTIIIQMIS